MGMVYGPVTSWRLGRSLGIDLLGGGEKRCSFDCVYCQLGRTRRPVTARGHFVDIENLERDIDAVGEGACYNVITFSGMGEPTLSRDLPEANRMVKKLTRSPTAVLTNSSLLSDEEVRQGLEDVDIVVAKLDAPSQGFLRRINRPARGVVHKEVVKGMEKFRDGFRGTFALQMMFLDLNLHQAGKMGALAKKIRPSEVHLNTPLHPCAVEPLQRRQLCRLLCNFGDLNVLMVYDFVGKGPEAGPPGMAGAPGRRPRRQKEVRDLTFPTPEKRPNP